MKKVTAHAVLAFLLIIAASGTSVAERIKDIARFSGVRENALIGYGLVVGLNGTGDKDGAYLFQPIANMLTRLGVTVSPSDVKGKTKNVAAVMVTAKLPTMVKPGTKLDVLVSSIGDAKSLQGGTLLLTPLKGPDGKVYAVAQGPVSVGGFAAGGGGTKAVKNHPTVGRIPEGAVVEREVPVNLSARTTLHLLLSRQDITTAVRVAERINEHLGGDFAKAETPSTVSVKVPDKFQGDVLPLMAEIEQIDVSVDVPAKVVVNERTGTVVIGENVKISPVALAHGGLTIQISTEYEVSQPPSFAPKSAETVVVPEKSVTAREKEGHLVQVRGATVGELVRALNALGVTPRDLVAILQAIKEAGSLRAELEII
ncbi:MAG: flagellar basal body P-ring protein FlgI [Deltaproteobacteria bacterium]|nr:MAG: flagellar basal body P-ring protein FlgI [Deltaproteobacteria bacterium]